MSNKQTFVWPYDYGESQALFDKIIAKYEAIKGTDEENEFIERLNQWIRNMEYPKDFHNNHRVLLQCIITASRSHS